MISIVIEYNNENNKWLVYEEDSFNIVANDADRFVSLYRRGLKYFLCSTPDLIASFIRCTDLYNIKMFYLEDYTRLTKFAEDQNEIVDLTVQNEVLQKILTKVNVTPYI